MYYGPEYLAAVEEYIRDYSARLETDEHWQEVFKELGHSYTASVISSFADWLEVARQGADYCEPVERNEGDKMTVDEFRSACATGFFLSSDGSAHPVKNRMKAWIDITPNTVDLIPPDATHIIWYNK